MPTIKLLQNKQIILGVTGGIAAYKSATICSRLVQAGAVVDVVMTEAAHNFITPLTFQALTHRPVYRDMFDIPAGENIPHIALADRADLLLIAPATAQTMAKLAGGLADKLTALLTRDDTRMRLFEQAQAFAEYELDFGVTAPAFVSEVETLNEA